MRFSLADCFSFRHFALAMRTLLAFLLTVPCVSQTTNQENGSAAQQGTQAPAAQRAPKNPETRAWTVLQQGLAEKSLPNRLMAVKVMGNIGPIPRGVKMVENALRDNDPVIREAAATSLGEMKAHAAVPKLRTAVDDRAPEVGLAAAESLWKLGDRRVRSVLLDVLAGSRPVSQGLIKKEEWDARRKLHDPKGLAIMGATHGADVLLGPMSFVVPLTRMVVGEKGISPRASTAALLATDHDPKSVKALETALKDKDWSVRAAAAKALGETRQPRFVSALDLLLLDDKAAVRYAAAASIIRIKWKKGSASMQLPQTVSARTASEVPAH
jgi:HEAT repeat protein